MILRALTFAALALALTGWCYGVLLIVERALTPRPRREGDRRC